MDNAESLKKYPVNLKKQRCKSSNYWVLGRRNAFLILPSGFSACKRACVFCVHSSGGLLVRLEFENLRSIFCT